jgi:glucokinase
MHYFAGIDLGGTSAKIGLVDREGRVLDKTVQEIAAAAPFTKIAELAAAALRRLVSRTAGELAAIGIGTPGFVDAASGIHIAGAENIPNLRGNSLARYLGNAFSVPVYAENDATCAAAGELKFGNGRRFRDFVLLTIGTGIGGGLVLNGRVYRGARGFAAEMGHMCVSHRGRWCNCGSQGCLEQYASAPAIQRLYLQKRLKRGLSVEEQVTVRDIFMLAGRENDPCAVDTVAETAVFIAQALGTLINILNPEACILAGGVSQAGEALLAPVRRCLADFAWPTLLEGTEVLAAGLANDAGLLGAAADAMDRYGDEI